MGKEWSDFDP